MIRRVPVRDLTRADEAYLLEGMPEDILPKQAMVYADRHGNTYDAQDNDVALRQLPEDGVVALPRTTWW